MNNSRLGLVYTRFAGVNTINLNYSTSRSIKFTSKLENSESKTRLDSGKKYDLDGT